MDTGFLHFRKLCRLHIPNPSGRVIYNRNSFLENSTVTAKKPAAPAGKKVFAVGDKVHHNVFGNGVVVKITPIANDSMLEITFESVGNKKVMANFAPVSKID